MRPMGRVHRLTVSSRLLFVLLVFCVIFAVAAVVVINKYGQLYFENQELRQKLDRVSRSLDNYQFQSKVLNQYNQLVTDLNKVEQKRTVDPWVKPESTPTTASAAEPPKTTEPTGLDLPILTNTGQLVDVEKLALELEPDNKAVKFQFTLNNLHPEVRSVSGFLFMVLANPATNPPTTAVYPEVDFKQGKPSDFKKGSQFNIRHGKLVRGRLDKLNQAGAFKQAWVYVYADDGQLLLKKMITPENG